MVEVFLDFYDPGTNEFMMIRLDPSSNAMHIESSDRDPDIAWKPRRQHFFPVLSETVDLGNGDLTLGQ
jgi:hypothetical protein